MVFAQADQGFRLTPDDIMQFCVRSTSGDMVPLALLGTVSALLAVNSLLPVSLANNLYVQIGRVLLIALSAKNAILIVEVARERYAEGMDAAPTAIEASQASFRPILMTSFAFILGVLPLLLASAGGANSRRSIGTP